MCIRDRIFSFLTITLRANQNVTGLALTIFGMGVANFFGVFILNGASYTAAPLANSAFAPVSYTHLRQLLDKGRKYAILSTYMAVFAQQHNTMEVILL